MHDTAIPGTQDPPRHVSPSVHAPPASAPAHAPPLQTSFCVHGFPSLQAVPFAGAPLHVPAKQASPFVQALPSSHGVPFGFAVPAQAPPAQASACVHGFLSLHT